MVNLVTHGPIKTVLIAFLALVLGTGHSVCACLSPNTNAIHADGHDMRMTHVAMEHQSHSPSSGDHTHSERTEPCSSGAGDCDHCASSALYKTSAKVDALASFAFAPVAKSIVADAVEAVTRGGTRTIKLVEFLWRGPPGETPTSLKIRLLI